MTSREMIVPYPLLQPKLCVDVPDTLCPMTYSCILCLCSISDLYGLPVLDLFSIWLSKICISPSLCLITCLPLFGYLQTFHFILKMNERMLSKWSIKIWYSPYIYIYLPLIYLPLSIYLPLFDTDVKGS